MGERRERRESVEKKPNIVFFLIDDMGWRDLSCTGSAFYETPNIDRIAAEGMRFTDAYATCPVCSPSRASMMTGKVPARVGITDYIGGNAKGRLIGAPYRYELPHTEATVATALRDAGYQTWHVGKWHLGGPEHYPDTHGFDVNIGGCMWGHPKDGYFSPWGIGTIEDGPKGEYLTDRLTTEAVKLISERDKGKPFYLNFWHYAVHIPIQTPGEHLEKYRRKAERMGLDKIDALVEGEHFPSLSKRHMRVTRRTVQSDIHYADMVENLDDNIGRVLAALEREGILDDTLIVFTSDNGGLSSAETSPTCNLPLSEGKGWMYEGGVREPLLIRWKGRVPERSVCRTPVTTCDFYPTFLEAAGAPSMPEQHVDGVSLCPLFDGRDLEDRALYWHYPHYGNQGGTPGSSIREGQWKLIEFFEDGRLLLFNLAEDEGETRDVSNGNQAIVTQLHGKLKSWRAEVGAKIPEVNPDYRPPENEA